jgi:hypothetical protein
MNIPDELEAVDKETLTCLVQRMLRSATVEVQDWEIRPLGGGFGNPVSRGLYHFAGVGEDQGEVVQWSLVLKMIQSPANVGAIDMGEGKDQTHWNYWKREKHVYQSDLLDDIPAGLKAPCCFGIEERPGNVIWLWLEEVEDVYGGKWSLKRYGLAARHFGRFNASFLVKQSLPKYGWLSVGLLRQWCSAVQMWAPRFSDFDRESSVWEDSRVRQIFPLAEQAPFFDLMEDRERFLVALDRLPQTICHRDAYPTNLMTRHGKNGEEETVALDWALTGVGPVGEEIAQLALGALDRIQDVEVVDIKRIIFDAYVEGLREVGWEGDAQVARFGFVTSTALRVGLMLLWALNQAIEQNGLEEPDYIEQGAKQARFVRELAEEAYVLLPSIG